MAPLLRIARTTAVSAAVLLCAAPGATQAAPSATPDPSYVTDGFVSTLARSGDTLYLGGAFSEIGPATGPGVSLSRATAARNATLPPVSGGAAPQVSAVVSDGSGGWWIGGLFETVGGVSRPNLAHVLADGTVGPALPAPDGPVQALALAPGGGTLYVGGSFTQLGGQARTRIAAIATATGALQGWAPTISNGAVLALAADATNVYAGGSFTGVGGVTGNRLIAFAASTGNVAWSGDANGDVLALAVDGSRVYAGGAFTTVLGATAAVRLAALNVNGTFAWNGNVTTAASQVDALLLSGTSLFAAGTFTAAGGTIGSGLGAARDRVARLTAATGVVDAWDAGANAEVTSLALAGSTLYLGGLFSTVGGQPRSRLASVDADTAAVLAWTPAAPNAPVRALAADSGNVYAGGDFVSLGMVARSNVAAIDLTTGEATAWAPSVGSEVYDLAATATTVYIAGAFNTVNGAPHDFIAAVRASDGQEVPGWNTSAQSYVNAIALSGSRLFIAGYFSSVNGTPAGRVAALNAADGTLVSGWSGSVTSGFPVNSLAVSPDGATLYLGGNFFELNGVPRFYMGALATSDGSLRAWDPAADENVAEIVPVGGLVYVGGGFVFIGGQSRRYVAALDAATANATAWNPDANSDVLGISVQGSTIYLGGKFTTLASNTVARNRLAAVDANTGVATSWNPSAGGDVLALIGASDGTLVAGGWFASLTTGPQARVAIFSSPPEPTSAPAVTGSPSPGQVLDCSPGAWTGSTPITYARQWLLDGAAIAGATATSYRVDDGDAGHALTCRVTASNRAGSASSDSTASNIPAAQVSGPAAQPPPAGQPPPGRGLPLPAFRKTANVYPLGGTVLVRAPGAPAFVPLTEPAQIRLGAIIDATRGRVRICTANAAGVVQCSEFYGGRFKLVQHGRGTRPITELILVGGDFRRCPRPRAAGAAAKRLNSKSVVRKLWGKGTGNFRTRGRFASATLRGTTWLTADRCDGTLVRVRSGAVVARDLVRRRNILLRARKGSRRSYLATPRARGR